MLSKLRGKLSFFGRKFDDFNKPSANFLDIVTLWDGPLYLYKSQLSVGWSTLPL